MKAWGGAALSLLRPVVGMAIPDGFNAGDDVARGEAVAVGGLFDLVNDPSDAITDLFGIELSPAREG